MAYNNANMLRIAQIGAMNRPQMRNMPTLDLSGAVDGFLGARDAAQERALAEQKRTQLKAYADMLKEQHPEDAARIDADTLGYMAMLDDNAKAERDYNYRVALQDMENKNKIGLVKLAAQLKAENYGIPANLPDGTPLTGNKKYDEAYMKEAGKKAAQKAAAEADSEEMKPALLQAMARADKAAKSGTGVGLLGGFAANFGINPLPNAGKNYADIQSANTQMNTYLRKQLAATGLTGSELNSAVEAEAYRYQIKPTDSESIIRRKLQNFAEDKLGGTVFNLNTGAPVQVGQKIGNFTVVGVE